MVRETSHLPYTIHGFLDDAAGHFGNTFLAVFKGYGHFAYFEAQLPGAVFHFYLEGITYKMYFIERYGAEDFSVIAYEARSRVVHRHPGDQFCIKGSAFGDKYAVPGPVYYFATLCISGADHQVLAFVAGIV